VATRFVNGLTLLAVDRPANIAACGALSLTTWWQDEGENPANDALQIYVVDDRSLPLAEGRTPLDGPQMDSRLVNRLSLDLPCDAPPGVYQGLLRLVDSATNEPVMIDSPDSARTLIPLGMIMITAGA
jgi:hypothetical protein